MLEPPLEDEELEELDEDEEEELEPPELLELDEELLDEDELLELDDEELLELPEAAGPIEHQAELLKLLDGNNFVSQVKLPVSVAYTKEPDLPSATVCVPLMVQAPPTWAHLV